MTASVSVLGIFAMDLIFRTNRLPVTGETVVGNSFATGPGGKGSNQAVAARRSVCEICSPISSSRPSIFSPNPSVPR